MAIDNLMSEDLNIKDLAIKIPERYERRLFDPLRDISVHDWKQIEDEVKSDTDTMRWVAFLNPEMARNDQNAWKKLVNDAKNSTDPTDELYQLSSLKIVNRQKAEIDAPISDDKWDFFKNQFRILQQGQGQVDHVLSVQMASYVSLIDSSKSPDFEVSEKNWNKLIQEINEFKDAGDLSSRARTLAFVKTAYPNQMDRLGISKEDWDTLKEEVFQGLGLRDDDRIFNLTWDAAALAILDAKEVKITEKGVELVADMPDSAGNFQPDHVPEVRRF
jgi:hypothetical protein